MFKSYYVHYRNKYPKAQVRTSANTLDVYAENGEHLIHLEKNGFGQLVDMSEEYGLPERHDLSPLPKESRQFKLYANGMCGKSEEHEERKAHVEANCDKSKGYYKVCSGTYGKQLKELEDKKELQIEAPKEDKPKKIRKSSKK